MKPRFKTLKQQRLDGELGLIIDEFGRAMWSADRGYIASGGRYSQILFTSNLAAAWNRYVEFCARNPK